MYFCCFLEYSQQWQSTAAATKAGDKFGSLDNRQPPQALRAAQTTHSFDIKSMTALLDHDNHDMRAKFR